MILYISQNLMRLLPAIFTNISEFVVFPHIWDIYTNTWELLFCQNPLTEKSVKKLFWLKVYSPLNNKTSNRDSFPLNYCLMSILTRYFRIPIFAPVCNVHILLLWKQQFRPIFPALTQSVLFLILLPPILMDFQLSRPQG